VAPLLEIRALSVRYGGVIAVNDVSFDIERGTFVGLIGPNGAGKTSFIDALTGFGRCTGSITFDGVELSSLPAHRRARLGISRTFQSQELFEDLTVRENLLVPAEIPSWWSVLADSVRPRTRAKDLATVNEALELVGISEIGDRYPGELSLGRRKLVTVARALSRRPRLLLLDEPAAGLDANETIELGLSLKRVVASGITLLLVDHDMGFVLNVCDRIHVLESGNLIASGTPAEVRLDDKVIHAYLGSQAVAVVHGESG
jgi:ABC-type branched-subunit amino acid transport system ATPase component